MSKRAEESAHAAYPNYWKSYPFETNKEARAAFIKGYEQAEKEIEKRIMKYLNSRNDSDYATVGRIRKHFDEYKKVIMEDSHE